MNKIIILLIVCFIATQSFSQFRLSTWAMDKEKIKEIETAEYIGESENSVTFKTNTGHWDAWCIYYYHEGNLYMAEYILELDYKNNNKYIEDYFKILEILKKKYGEPEKSDDYIWLNETHKEDPERHGFAVSAGQLKLNNKFITPNMHIVPVLKGSNFACELRIQYINPYYKVNNSKSGF